LTPKTPVKNCRSPEMAGKFDFLIFLHRTTIAPGMWLILNFRLFPAQTRFFAGIKGFSGNLISSKPGFSAKWERNTRQKGFFEKTFYLFLTVFIRSNNSFCHLILSHYKLEATQHS